MSFFCQQWRRTTLTLMLALVAGTAAFAQSPAPMSIADTGVALVNISRSADSLGLLWSYEPHREVMVLRSGKDSALFSVDMAAMRVRDSVMLMSTAPVRRGEALYASSADLGRAFSYLTGAPRSWDGKGWRKVTPQTGASAPSREVALSNPLAQGIRTVVIDPGHGGKDPGCVSPGGILEKNITLGIALKLRDLLKANSTITAKLTRSTDVYVKLSDRTKMANEWKADLFVSIHVDAVPGTAARKQQVRGHKVYFLSQAKNEEDKMVAMRENAVVEMEDTPQEYDFLKNLITDLVGNEYLNESQDFSILLSETFEKKLSSVGKLHLGVGQAPFWVLNGAYMPSVLIEAGFISHPTEAKLLAKESVQKEIAQAIRAAIVEFSNRYGARNE